MEIIKEKTSSICPETMDVVSAKIYEQSGSVVMEKDCPLHGITKVVIEKNARFYKQITGHGRQPCSADSQLLALPVTFRCNLRCPMCYSSSGTDKTDIDFKEITSAVDSFKGDRIKITGGDPTAREDLPEIIRYISEKNIKKTLVTNGVKLAEYSYIKKLRDAGLERVAISFSSMEDNIYVKIRGEKLLKKKLKALENMKKLGIEAVLSMTIIRGVNEGELSKVYRFFLKNRPFITDLRLRTMSPVGRHLVAEPFYLSEIVDMFAKASGFEFDELVEAYLHNIIFTPASCRVRVDLFSAFAERVRNKGLDKANIFSKVGTVLESMMLFGLRRTKIIKGAVVNFRVWPDKYRIDLDENKKCITMLYNREGELKPFCYEIINESSIGTDCV